MSDMFERVRVYNGNSFDIHDRHDGVPYDFPAGEAVVIPADAAQHMFGFPGDEQDMHAYMARRFGWNRPQDYMGKDGQPNIDEHGLLPWQKKCRAMRLTSQKYELKRVRPADEPIPADEAGEADEVRELAGPDADLAAPTRTVVGRRRTAARSRRSRPPRRRTAPAPAPTISPAPPATPMPEPVPFKEPAGS